MLKFHQRAQTDILALRKGARVELGKLGNGGFQFSRLPGLPAGEIGSLEAAGVVFVLGFVLLMRGLGAGKLRGAEIDFELADELGGDFFDDGALIHDGEKGIVSQLARQIQAFSRLKSRDTCPIFLSPNFSDEERLEFRAFPVAGAQACSFRTKLNSVWMRGMAVAGGEKAPEGCALQTLARGRRPYRWREASWGTVPISRIGTACMRAAQPRTNAATEQLRSRQAGEEKLLRPDQVMVQPEPLMVQRRQSSVRHGPHEVAACLQGGSGNRKRR